MSRVQSNEVRDVTIKGESITGSLTSGGSFQTYAPPDSNVVPTLREHGVTISALPSSDDSPTIWSILISGSRCCS